jgi:hypothetical protein
MRSLMVLLTLSATIAARPARGDASAVAEPKAAAAPEVAQDPTVHVGAAFLSMPLGKIATGSAGNDTSSNLDFAYGVGVWAGIRVAGGLSLGVAPQALFHLSAMDSDGYPVIDSKKEYDLMARIAYAYAVVPKVAVYAEALPGYSLVTYDKIVVGSKAPRAHGIVIGGGLGALVDIDDRLFVNVGVGYQAGFQVSHGITEQDVKTRFLRIALGGGVKL